jgi:hypothetical protein
MSTREQTDAADLSQAFPTRAIMAWETAKEKGFPSANQPTDARTLIFAISAFGAKFR